MPDYAATPRYDAPKAATPVPVSSDREHEVADISARTTSRLAIGMAAATMALAGTVAVMHSDSVSKTVSNLLANVSRVSPPPLPTTTATTTTTAAAAAAACCKVVVKLDSRSPSGRRRTRNCKLHAASRCHADSPPMAHSSC